MNQHHLRVKQPSTLVAQLKADEGQVLFPYTDTTGHQSIGVGRNLTQHGISPAEAEFLLHNDITEFIHDARIVFKDFDNFPPAVQHVIIGMLFNLGLGGFKKFKKTIRHINAGRWADAADELLDSRAARQLPKRYNRYAKQLRGLISK